MNTTDAPAIQAILAAGAAARPSIDPRAAKSYFMAPAGYELKEVPAAELPPLPDHIRQAVTLDDQQSFVAYVKRNKDTARSVIFAQLAQGDTTKTTSASFLAIFDYHDGQDDLRLEPDRVARCAHRALYPCPFSLEFRAWLDIDGKAQSQDDFLDFLDANASDVIQPPCAELRELARDFSAKTEVVFQSNVNRTVKGVNLIYQEKTETGTNGLNKKIEVPGELVLRLPIFEGGEVHEIPARIAWDPRGGSLKITVHLQRVARLVRTAFGELVDAIGTATELQPFFGQPK